MINKNLILRIFDAFYMHRWNDKLRPIEFIEMDKQAHKMMIAYILGKYEENNNNKIDWIKIIEGGIFELLQRIILTDLKPQIFYKIKEKPDKYKKLNEWIYEQLKPDIICLGENFCDKFFSYLLDEDNTIERKILNCAHLYSSKWEYEIIKYFNPKDYDMGFIVKDFENKLEQYNDLYGLKEINFNNDLKKFIDLCGQLRYQYRWAHLHRIPYTSVLGHSLFVAIFSYFFTIENNGCEKRCYNNFFTGLFHDIPEILTRDVISPIKRAIEGLDDLIKEYEIELMNENVYNILPEFIKKELQLFVEDEFSDVYYDNNIKYIKDLKTINKSYNNNKYNPRDGTLVKCADEISAFIEAYSAIKNGSINNEFYKSVVNIIKIYSHEKKIIGNINFKHIFNEFKKDLKLFKNKFIF